MFKLTLANQKALTRFAQSLVKTASFSGMEGNLAQQLVEEMNRVGFDEANIDDMGNVIGRLGTGQGPVLLLYTHLDTAGIGDTTAWKKDPFAALVEDGILFGRGAADPKGALASMVYSIKLLKEQVAALNGTLYLIGGVQGEPAETVAVRYLLEEKDLQADWVILGAPTNLRLHCGHRGRLEIGVKILGRACHAATPERGINAITGAARIIFSLEMMSSMLGQDDLLGAGTLAVTHVENIERTKNIIPDCCSFIIDRRLTMGETEAHVLAEIQGLLAKEGIEGVVEVTNSKSVSYTGKAWTEKRSYSAWLIDEKAPLVTRAGKAVQKITGLKPRLAYWKFSTAGAYTMGYAGIPTIGFGPGDERFAHTANEHIKLGDCFTAACVYAQMIADLL